jgi:ParB/RepB/Spo0J family partition protein
VKDSEESSDPISGSFRHRPRKKFAKWASNLRIPSSRWISRNIVDADSQSVTVTKVRISSIDAPGHRLKTDQDIEEIARSLEIHGQFFPIRIREHPSQLGRYQVIFGNRRLAAAKKIGWDEINADIVKASDVESLTMALSENIDRKDFSDYEKALLLQKLNVLMGKTIEEIAALVNRSPSYVSQHISMLHLFADGMGEPEEVSGLLQLLTERHARALAKINDPEERFNTAKLAIKANLGVRELEKICGRPLANKIRTSSQRNEGEIRRIIADMMDGLNSKDLSQFFRDISKRYFTMFSRFPPFNKMQTEEAMDYLSNVLHQMSSYRVKIEDLDIKIFQNFAYATFFELHRIGIMGKTVKTRTRATIIFAKEEGTWKIMHEHWSSANASELVGWISGKPESLEPVAAIKQLADRVVRNNRISR